MSETTMTPPGPATRRHRTIGPAVGEEAGRPVGKISARAAPKAAARSSAGAGRPEAGTRADRPAGKEFPNRAPLAGHGPARVIALCNQKGGVGKTTSTINLGAALAEYGRRVLLVDLDPQGALSAGLGIAAHELERTIYNLMLARPPRSPTC